MEPTTSEHKKKDRRWRRRHNPRRVRYLDYPTGGYPYQAFNGSPYPSMQPLNYYGINPYYNNNPVYNQNTTPFTIVQQPLIAQSCSCLTSDVPFSVAHSVQGGVSNQGGRQCTPGDDRCWCYDTCNTHLGNTGMGGIGWNCGNKSVGGKMFENSVCNHMPGLNTKF